jgi:putative pyruvate formate lyase activating enzyme
MRCLYCQNYPWSQDGQGQAHGVEALADIFRSLKARGGHNLNLVSPTPWLPMIDAAMRRANEDGVSIPVVYNTSGYERVETLARYQGLTDVYLTDLRYASPDSAAEGSGARDYVETARAALGEMVRQTGPLRTDGDGVAVSGTVCRILVLPGRAGEASENLRWIAEHFGDRVAVSVMAQYVPAYRAASRAPWNRRVFAWEYGGVCDVVEELGLTHGWVQEYHEETSEELVGFRMKAGES